MHVGMSKATSSAWLGPESATVTGSTSGRRRATSPAMTSVIVSKVPSSRPLVAHTSTVSGRRYGAAAAAMERTKRDDVTKTTTSFSATASSTLVVRAILAGSSGSPGSGMVRVASRRSTTCSDSDHTTTSCPSFEKSRASARPHAPLPKTPTRARRTASATTTSCNRVIPFVRL